MLTANIYVSKSFWEVMSLLVEDEREEDSQDTYILWLFINEKI